MTRLAGAVMMAVVMKRTMHRRAVHVVVLIAAASAGCGSSSPPAAKPPPKALTFLTYNVLADEVELDKRIPPLMKLLDESDADVIALQEVAPWFLERLGREEWVRAKRYDWTRFDGRTAAPGGQFILSKLPIASARFAVLPGPQRRTAVAATLQVDGRSMAVATTHMESLLEDGPVRAKQLDAIFPLVKDADDGVVLGDFNFGDAEQPDTSHLDKAYVDLWLALKPGDPGFTWNMEASDMARKGSFPNETSRRIDRILIRSEVWKPKAIRIIGDAPVTPGDRSLFPSDHFGLAGSVERQ